MPVTDFHRLIGTVKFTRYFILGVHQALITMLDRSMIWPHVYDAMRVETVKDF